MVDRKSTGTKPGEVYASRHKNDIARGKRQRRVVVLVAEEFALLQNARSRRKPSAARLDERGRITGHRRVNGGTPATRAQAAQAAEELRQAGTDPADLLVPLRRTR